MCNRPVCDFNAFRSPLACLATLVCAFVMSVAAAGCSAGMNREAAPVADPALHLAGCARHDQCDADAFCDRGTCTRGVRDVPARVAEEDARLRQTGPDGSCDTDAACGPWLCDAGACVAPETRGHLLPTRAQMRYWDGACADTDDCGPWQCEAGWCRPQVRISNDSPHLVPLAHPVLLRAPAADDTTTEAAAEQVP